MLRRFRPAVGAIGVVAAIAACGTAAEYLGDDDPTRRDTLGWSVLGLRWSQVVVDRSTEDSPQEFASPAVWNDRLFVGSRGGAMFALSADDGTEAWKRKVGAISSRPLVHRGRIYVGTDDGHIVCLETGDGSERWRYATRGAISRTPVLAADMVLFGNESDQVYALDAETGAYRWQYKGELPDEYTLRGHAGVTVDGDLAFTGLANGTVVALRTASGSVAWMTSLKGRAERFVDVDAQPTVVGDTVYASSAAGGVYALDRTTGLVKWRLPLEGAGTVLADGDRLYVAAADAGVHALDLSGHILWRQGLRGGGEPADLVVVGDYLIYTLADAGLFIADKRSGVVRQYFDPGYGISAQPTVDEHRMYVLSNSAILYAFQLAQFPVAMR
jgi:outer membrane protein assembly factor BamB